MCKPFVGMPYAFMFKTFVDIPLKREMRLNCGLFGIFLGHNRQAGL
jgi:hypothetical protein